MTRLALLLLLCASSASAFSLALGRAPAVCAQRHAPLAMKKKASGGKKGMVKVVLMEPVKGIGKKNELVDVKSAYAENFLLNSGKAVRATPDMLKQLAAEAEQKSAEAAAAKAAAVDADKKLQEVFAEGALVKKNVGPDGGLFGSVTKTELAEIIEAQAGIKVEIRNIKPPDMKVVGEGTAEVQLHKEVVSKLKVVVVSSSAYA